MVTAEHCDRCTAASHNRNGCGDTPHLLACVQNVHKRDKVSAKAHSEHTCGENGWGCPPRGHRGKSAREWLQETKGDWKQRVSVNKRWSPKAPGKRFPGISGCPRSTIKKNVNKMWPPGGILLSVSLSISFYLSISLSLYLSISLSLYLSISLSLYVQMHIYLFPVASSSGFETRYTCTACSYVCFSKQGHGEEWQEQDSECTNHAICAENAQEGQTGRIGCIDQLLARWWSNAKTPQWGGVHQPCRSGCISDDAKLCNRLYMIWTYMHIYVYTYTHTYTYIYVYTYIYM